jgi:alpha-tubulin suppressor-like RCC1 family protein
VLFPRRQLLQASLIALIAGCGDATDPDPDPGSGIAEVHVFDVVWDSVPVLVGEVEFIRASLSDAEGNNLSLVDSTGQEIPERRITWSSSDPSKAQVAAAGLGPAGIYRSAQVTGVAPGRVTIHAAAGGKEGSIQVIVLERAASLPVTPTRLGIVPTGETNVQYDFLDAAGNGLDHWGRSVSWTTSDPAVADVSTDGAVLGVGPGSATITVSGSGAESSLPVDVSLLTFTSVATAVHATCGMTTAGEAWCWGTNFRSLFLAFPSVIPSATPLRIEGGGTFAAISPGATEICGLGTDGTVYCWGDNVSGQLGRGFGASDMIPTPVAGGLHFSAVSSGEDFVCGLTPTGKPYCWGAGSQLGTGTADDSGVPVPVAGDLSLTSISTPRGNPDLLHQVRHTCGVATDGKAWCWGNNAHGELGDNTTTDRLVPVLVAGSLTFSSISAGVLHSCGIAANQAYCWGDNSYGQLGSSSPGEVIPAPVAGGLAFSSVSAGFTHTCGFTTAGVAYCWGQNDVGQLGDGSNTASSSPVSVSGGHTFSSVSAGDRYTCGLTVQQTAYCWGGAEVDVVPPPTGTGAIGSTVPVRVIGQP